MKTETWLRNVVIRAVSAATGWSIVDIIDFDLTTSELCLLADVELAQ